MLSRSYKLIIVLLSVSMLSVLLLQGFWISNFYTQKQEEFRRSVYEVLGNINARLNEMDHLSFIKKSVSPVKATQTKIIADTQKKLKAKNRGRSRANVKASAKATVSSSDIRIITSSSNPFAGDTSLHILQKLNLDTLFDRQEIIISDSMISINNNGRKIYINQQSAEPVPDKNEIDQLLNKMLMEIETIDVSPIEDLTADTLKQIIGKELEASGMFMSFEFLLKKQDEGTDKIIARSEHYNDSVSSYKSDLSGKRVFSDHNYLYLQLPQESDYVFARMKNLIVLSAIFSLVMILVFYMTLRSIMRQKKLGDMKNDFINNMTHELKTPIATISLAIDAISNPQIKDDKEKFEQYAAILKEENQKLNAHVEHVLQMARLDKGDLQLQHSQVDLNRLVQASVAAHQLQIKSMKAKVDLDLVPSLYIKADEFHIATVINNLLDNALKYSQENCQIHISTKRLDGMAVLSISDNGIGIDESLHKKIFEKFYRVQSGNLHDTKGFGLGLSYVKSIVEKHGGSIGLKSVKDKGSEFMIKLPAHGN
jgi:two-component system phosphate regulon sensor histidine kinase PhoR